MPEPQFDQTQYQAQLEQAVQVLTINGYAKDTHLATLRAQIQTQDEEIALLKQELESKPAKKSQTSK